MFEKLLDSIDRNSDQWEVMEELMALRADFLIHHAIDGFGGTYEDAIDLLRYAEDLTPEQEARRNVILAAVDNLVDFAVAEEYQMAMDLPEDIEDLDVEDIDLEDEDDEESITILSVFKKYNLTYANVENMDVEYAMIVAAGMYGLKETTILTYMTQGDYRVRPWHLQYEGFSAPKSRFPGWLVPPIEHGCRCFLVEDTVMAKMPEVKNERVIVPTMPFWFNPTFKESVAFGGRIFSDEHPYFQIREAHRDQLEAIANRIKARYFNGQNKR